MRTSDPQDELFEVHSPDGEPTGMYKRRGDVHRDGDWHRALHIWIYSILDGEPHALFQRRSLTKDTWPGRLDVAVGGHIRAGETLEETAREAEEEIGLDLRLSDLTRIGRRFADNQGDTVIDREINEVFGYRSDLPLNEYRLHPEEVSGIVAIPLGEVIALFRGERVEVAGIECDQAGIETSRTYRQDDFVPDRDGYTPLALTQLARLADGEVVEPFLLRAGS
ncbi:MAG: NUDIX hydrolase [Chloroflexota bacterium]